MKCTQIQVDFINHMGSDLDVVNVARVSFDKSSTWDIVEANMNPWDCGFKLKDKDEKLIKYLAEHGHWSPFSHCFLQFRIKAPIFVARQLVKHQVGLSWNEVSRRYVDSEPEFFTPDYWRKRADNVKQGSSDERVDLYSMDIYGDHPVDVTEQCLDTYQRMLNMGVCAEQARMILPQNTMTEWYWSGSLYAFARVCNQRLDSHSQKETQEVAKQIYEYIKDTFPVSSKYLIKQGD